LLVPAAEDEKDDTLLVPAAEGLRQRRCDAPPSSVARVAEKLKALRQAGSISADELFYLGREITDVFSSCRGVESATLRGWYGQLAQYDPVPLLLEALHESNTMVNAVSVASAVEYLVHAADFIAENVQLQALQPLLDMMRYWMSQAAPQRRLVVPPLLICLEKLATPSKSLPAPVKQTIRAHHASRHTSRCRIGRPPARLCFPPPRSLPLGLTRPHHACPPAPAGLLLRVRHSSPPVQATIRPCVALHLFSPF
jgi:hypothetical protein